MKQIIFSALFLATAAQAQVYVGAGVGYGSGVPDSTRQFTGLSIERTQESATANAFIGYRFGSIAVETGVMTMPEYHSTVSTDNYPAYKGCVRSSTCPQTSHIQQDIMSRAYYLRANVYAPKVAGIEPYVFGGYAKTDTHNHEYGNYDNTETVDFKIDAHQQAWFFGAGLQKNVSNKWSIRAEALVMPAYVDEEHTGRRHAWVGSVAIQRSF